jgi:hypothetical protein
MELSKTLDVCNLPNLLSHNMALELTQLVTKMSTTKSFCCGKERPPRKATDLAAMS